MKILVTGSAGHLGEAVMRTLRAGHAASIHEAVGLDRFESTFTDRVGSIVDRAFVDDAMQDVDAVIHAATLHKPHVATRSRKEFVDVNVTGTLNLLEAAVAAGVGAFVYTSTTSAFGDALQPAEGAPATWVTEDTVPVPKNIYGITKLAAENLCDLMHRLHRLPCIVLRTSRFFPEDDDVEERREAHADANLKVNELLYRRADLEDIVDAHLLAVERAPAIGFGRYIVSATSPFTQDDLAALRTEPASVIGRRIPQYAKEYARRGWTMLDSIDRVYVNDRARQDLGWQPRHDFGASIERLSRDEDFRSPLTRAVGRKNYHRTR